MKIFHQECYKAINHLQEDCKNIDQFGTRVTNELMPGKFNLPEKIWEIIQKGNADDKLNQRIFPSRLDSSIQHTCSTQQLLEILYRSRP